VIVIKNVRGRLILAGKRPFLGENNLQIGDYWFNNMRHIYWPVYGFFIVWGNVVFEIHDVSIVGITFVFHCRYTVVELKSNPGLL
jgi:hypothetical protein